LDLRRFRGLFKTENGARKGEHCPDREVARSVTFEYLEKASTTDAGYIRL
jgi:hypothetical protein